MQATDQGLTEGESKIRLAKYGLNKLTHKKRNPLLQYLGYMWNPLSWVRSWLLQTQSSASFLGN